MSKSRKSKDPFASREAENYANPVPSREFILEQLEALAEPASYDMLCKHLGIKGADAAEGLRRRLIAMSRDGQIINNRRGAYGLPAHMDLVKGRVQGNKDGFGFFVPEDDSDDLFLGAREMESLFDGDIVLARMSGLDHRGRKEGMVVEILERRHSEIVGRYFQEPGFGIVVPANKRINHEIMIPSEAAGGAKDGQFVVAELTQYPRRRHKAIATITEVLGDTGTPGVEIDIALRSHDIPDEFPDAVIKEAERIPSKVSESQLTGRFDLRKLPFVTIDGEDAKDFDDAVYARRNISGNRLKGYTLFVAIADVSFYVRPRSELDEEATNRGTSVYFPGHVVPMLPESLSNGMCSLRPNEDRLTMVAEIELSEKGEIRDYCFYEAVIHSHARLTYNEVADIVQPSSSETGEKVKDKLRKRHDSLIEDLDNLYELYKLLSKARKKAGALDFDTVETRMVFGADQKIREIIPVQRNDAHRLIEECMLCANVCTARLFEDLKQPALYRIHEGPNPDKLDDLREYLNGMGLYLPGGDDPDTADYQKLLETIGERPDKALLQTMVIRSMMQAVYQPENIGHFGLGFSAYTHFTSPIRRYPDLLVHRAIRYLVRNKQNKHLKRHDAADKLPKAKIYPYETTDLVGLGEHCSMAERRADAASYSVQDWLKCEYMQDKIGKEFSGAVVGVTSFGLFVELDDIFIQGLVHITELSNDYYRFDPVHHVLEGERSGQAYRLGDTVQVKLVRVDLDERKIDLQMVGVQAVARKKSGSRKAGVANDRQTRRGKNAKTAAGKKHKGKGKGKDRSKRKSGGKSPTQAKSRSKAGAGRGKPKKKSAAGKKSRAARAKGRSGK